MEFKGKTVKELEEQIVFRAYNNKFQQPVKAMPAEDETGKLFTGQGTDGYFESLSEADKHKMAFVIDNFTTVTISDGKTLKPGNLIDRENWRWVQFSPYICLDRAKGASSRSAVYYVENRKAEAERRISTTRDRDRARYLLQFDLSYEAQLKVAKVIGHPGPEGFSPIELQDYLLTQAETIPSAILQAADPKNAEESGVKIAFHDLLKWRIVEKHRGGVFRFGGPDGIFLGHNEGAVMEYLKNSKNEETVAAILSELEARKQKLSDNPGIPAVLT